jgi:uncharacterized repeat protein (TIGR04138 family)
MLHAGGEPAKLDGRTMQDADFPRIVALICKEDTRFDRKAYDFVRLGLDHTVKEIRKKDSSRAGKTRHVTGPELLDGLKVYALEQFGPLTKTVLNSWGIRRCKDFGDIVFNLIEYNAFSKTENDKREDFKDLYDFDEVFVKPFLPTRRPKGASAAEALGSA